MKYKLHQSNQVPVGNGFVAQPIPQKNIEEGNPFILLHHAKRQKIDPGKGFYVPPHPHKGFQPVTFVYEGEVLHHDSLGNKEVVNDLGVQWINAGKGLMHSEGMPESFNQKGGYFEMIQLWINLPSDEKHKAPSYHHYNKKELNKIRDNANQFFIVSGEINKQKGPHQSINNVVTAMGLLKKDEESTIDYIGNTKAIFVLNGSVNVNDIIVNAQELIIIEQEDRLKIKAMQDAKILILGGDKINEPIKAYGPYVMNTQSEIIDALNEFDQGKMGQLN